MTDQALYFLQHEFNVFEQLVNTKQYVTKAEYEFIIAYDPTEKANFTYIATYGQHKGCDYLNLNVYSEHNHEERQLQLETT